MYSIFLFIGGIMGFLSVAFGAFGAHALKSRIDADSLSVFHTGVQYQMMHAIALLIVAFLCKRYPSGLATGAGWCFIAGIILFSGSLYALSITKMKVFGPITPLGGVAFLVGWILLAFSAFSSR